MRLGEIYSACPSVLSLEVDHGQKRYTPIPGKVVFVHPAGRFVVLEFNFKNYLVRETFYTLTKKEKDELCGPLQL